MNLKTFKDHFVFRPLQIIVIDRPFVLDGEDMHIVALTYEQNSYTLWVMDCLSEDMNEDDRKFDPLTDTNRVRLRRRKMPEIRSIKTLEIGENVFPFDGATIESFHGDSALLKLEYFIEQGVELSQWYDADLSKMQLTKHTYSGENPMVPIDLQDEVIKLKFRPYHKEAEVFYKYSVDFNLDQPVELKYYNLFEEQEEYFYVHRFETYGLENYINSLEDHEKHKNVPEEHLDRIKDIMVTYFEDLKHRNSSLVLMTYEAERGLSFQSTEYLDRKIQTSSSRPGLGFIFRPDKESGEYGMRLFVASFHDVSNDQLDPIEFELHSVSKEYQEEIIVI